MRLFLRVQVLALCFVLAICNAISNPVFSAPAITDEGKAKANLVLSSAKYDVGMIVPILDVPIDHTFVVRNDTASSLTLDRLEPSCGCTSATIEANQNPQIVILPGHQIAIRVSINPALIDLGPIDKAVWVYVKGQSEPAATLEMVGTALPRANFSTPQVNLGRVNAGASVTAPLTITMQQNQLPSGMTLRIASSNPDIEITQDRAKDDQTTDPHASSPIPYAYTVALSPKAHLGSITAQVSCFLVSNTDGKEYLAGTTEVTAQVAGDISVSPNVVGFGSVPFGQKVTQEVIVTGKTARDLTAISNSPNLTVRLKPLDTTNNAQFGQPFGTGHSTPNPSLQIVPPAMALLEVSLSDKTSSGSFSTQITITTTKGQQWTLPVYANIGRP